MDLGIKGENALVLAGTRGIGFGCTQALAEAGCKVAFNGLSEESGKATMGRLKGHDAHFVRGDVMDPKDRDRIYAEAREWLGADVTILVTNSTGPAAGTFLSKSPDDWRQAFEGNMLNAVDFAYKTVPGMIARGFGRIVNINSMSGKEPSYNTPLGNGVKAAMIGAMAALAREVADKGVTVNNLLPGPIDTELLRRYTKFMLRRPELDDDTATRLFAETVPAKRIGTIQEMGAICAFLASRHAGFITGQNIAVDGGVINTIY
jgi:3-oxoacyl-[acyl-carrier protein] reductase